MEEIEIQCPCCWEHIQISVDSSVSDQEYVEDCSVCCNPLLIHVLFDPRTRELIEIKVDRS